MSALIGTPYEWLLLVLYLGVLPVLLVVWLVAFVVCIVKGDFP